MSALRPTQSTSTRRTDAESRRATNACALYCCGGAHAPDGLVSDSDRAAFLPEMEGAQTLIRQSEATPIPLSLDGHSIYELKKGA
jgi:hypothetical protein